MASFEQQILFKTKVTGKEQIDDLGRRFQDLGKSIADVGKSLSLRLTAPLAALGALSVRNFAIQERALGKVRIALQNNGKAAGFTFEELQKAASELQNFSTFGDEAILEGVTAQFLTFGNITGEQFSRAQQAAIDLSAAMGTDLSGAALQVGKALSDPAEGLSALGRVGIRFNQEQKDLIQGLLDTGKTAEAQSVILDELEKRFKGVGAEMARVGLGPLQQLKNSFGDLLEDFGGIILKGINPIIEKLKDLVKFFKGLSDGVKNNIVIFASLAAALGPLLILVGTFISVIVPLALKFSAMALVVTGLKISLLGLASAFGFIVGAVLLVIELEKRFSILSDTGKLIFGVLKSLFKAFFEVARSVFGLTGSFGDFSKISKILKNSLDLLIAFTLFPLNGILALIAKSLQGFIALLVAASKIPVLGRVISQEALVELEKANQLLDSFVNTRLAQTSQAFQDIGIEKEIKKNEKAQQEFNATLNQAPPIIKEIKEEVQEVKQELKAIDPVTSGLKSSLENNLTNGLTDFATATTTAAQAFSNMTRSILNDIIRMINQQLVLNALTSFFPAAPAAAAPAAPAAAAAGGFAAGGLISGQGTGTSDSILARVSSGEFVLRKSAVDRIGLGNLHRLNKLDLAKFNPPRFANGGEVMPTGSSGGSMPVSVEIKNDGAQKRVANTSAQFDGKSLVLSVFLEDLQRNGDISQSLSGTFGIKRRV